MYDDAVPHDAASLLDVGCNLGVHTAHFASRGLISLGVDVSADLVTEARALNAEADRCAFMVLDLDPSSVAALPAFDVVLALSVHHNWVDAHGFDGAGELLVALMERTNKVLLFEGAARRSRYGAHPPDFVDNDEASVTKHLSSFLDEHLGGLASRIVPLGSAAAVGEREPRRWSWAVYR